MSNPNVETVTADKLIQTITEILIAASGEQLAQTANGLLGNKFVRFVGERDGTDTFEILEKPKFKVGSSIILSDNGEIEWPDDDGNIRRVDKDGNTEEIRRPGDDDYNDWLDLFPAYVTPALIRFFAVEIENEEQGGVSPATLQSALDSWDQAPQPVLHEFLGQDDEVGAYDGLATVETNEANDFIDARKAELDRLIKIHGGDTKLETFTNPLI
jgi:hypothetical protein